MKVNNPPLNQKQIPSEQQSNINIPEKKPNKLLKIIIVIIILLVLMATGAFGFWLYQEKIIKKPVSSPTPLITSSPLPIISPGSTTPDDWKTYTDEQIGYTIRHPSEMIPSRGNCDSFILPASDEERKKVTNIKKSGIEIGYLVKGLELAFCIVGNPNNLNVEGFAKSHTPNADFDPLDLASLNYYEGLKVSSKNFIEYFIATPRGKILRIWYRCGQKKYQNMASQILSTFKFTD